MEISAALWALWPRKDITFALSTCIYCILSVMLCSGRRGAKVCSASCILDAVASRSVGRTQHDATLLLLRKVSHGYYYYYYYY